MSDNRILLIESAARLSVDHGRLCIAREHEEPRYVAVEDISVLCLDHYAVSLSNHVLKSLAEAGAAVLVTNASHLPSGMMLCLHGRNGMASRVQQQMALAQTDRSVALWRQIVTAKIRSQALNLRYFNLNGALRLDRLAKQVEPGDASNLEAQAARHYWAHFFPEGFRREKRQAAHHLNLKLNYGYAVLRAMIARHLAMAGLCLAIGIGHKSSENPFNLADDFLEPYRFIVDRHIKANLADGESFERQDRKEILEFVLSEVQMKGNDYRFSAAVEETVNSFCRSLEDPKQRLSFPV